MLMQLGRRAVSDNVVDLLVECHGRIRTFLAMARGLANAPASAPATEIADTAAQVRRYFAEGFALHVEDEEREIAPRIAGDAATRLCAEHAGHARAVGELVELCDDLAREPQHLAAIAERLRVTSTELTAELEAHLAFEEATVFPAVRALDAPQQAAIKDAMRKRRETSLGT